MLVNIIKYNIDCCLKVQSWYNSTNNVLIAKLHCVLIFSKKRRLVLNKIYNKLVVIAELLSYLHLL